MVDTSLALTPQTGRMPARDALDNGLFTAPTVPYSTAQGGGAYSLDPDCARIRTASTQVSVSAKSVTSSFQWRSAAASL